jgi:hypothetical protein
MTGDEIYAAVIRQAAHDAVHALVVAPPDSPTGSLGLRDVIEWLGAEHGDAAARDLAAELAVDLGPRRSLRSPAPKDKPP